MYAPGRGLVDDVKIINDATHEDWSGVSGMVEFSDRRYGKVGEVHPTVVPAAAVMIVAEKKLLIYSNFNCHFYDFFYETIIFFLEKRDGVKLLPRR